MYHTPLAMLLTAALAMACARDVARAPRLPTPPANAAANAPLLPFERAGFFFVIPTERGGYLQLGDVLAREAAEAPPKRHPPALERLLPELVLTLTPREAPVPELHGRDYTVWRGVRPLCRAKASGSVLLGRIKPDQGDWDVWGIDPWAPNQPPLAVDEAKLPRTRLWRQSRKVKAALLPNCGQAPPTEGDDALLWARPTGLPAPALFLPDAAVNPAWEKAAIERVRAAGFDDKVERFRQVGRGEPEVEHQVASLSHGGVTLVEVRSLIYGGSECGDGSLETWGLFRADDHGMTTLGIFQSRRALRLAGDLDGDGHLELVLQGQNRGKTLILYRAHERGGLKELQRSTYPSHGDICGTN